MRRSIGLLALLLTLTAQTVLARQDAATAYMFSSPTTAVITLDVGQPLAQPFALTPANLTVRYLPSKRAVPSAQIAVSQQTGSLRRIIVEVKIAPANQPADTDETVEIKITNLQLQGGATVSEKVITGEIYTSSNIDKFVQATSEALAPSKTTDEKNLFTGLNIGLPSKDGAVQGDLVFNRDFVSIPAQFRRNIADSGAFGVKVKKGSVDGKDPRHFNLGFTLRKTFLLADPADLDILRQAVSPGVTSISNTTSLQALENVRSRFFKAILLDYGLQMEADVSKKGLGNVSNLLMDVRPQLATGAMTALGENSEFTFRFMPAGFELGRNVSNPDKQTQELGSLARYKAAAEVALYYESKAANPMIQRVELNVSSVYRRLLTDETSFNAKTETNVDTARGDKLWTQGDFKIFLGPPFNGMRAGLKATYQRGYLPPVFTRTKVFTYGLVFESIK